ncbi:hypothetical protein EV127DRAFT_429002 [Xylaria flabelliformis]|nr:hypothetical protein EV127DRAFT_429002 [Xylaria flabelliformis]
MYTARRRRCALSHLSMYLRQMHTTTVSIHRHPHTWLSRQNVGIYWGLLMSLWVAAISSTNALARVTHFGIVIIFRPLLLVFVLLHVLCAQTLGGVVIPGIQSERG